MIPWIASALAGEPECRTALDREAYAAAAGACATCEGPRAAWCEGRMAWLAIREDPGGGFAGAERLAAIRRSRDVAGAHALEADPAGSDAVRAQAAIWLDDPGSLGRWADRSLPPEIARVIRARLSRPHPPSPWPDRLCGLLIGGFALATLPAVRRGTLVLQAPVVFAGIALAGWLLLELFERGAGAPLVPMALGLVPVITWSSVALTGTPPERRIPVRLAAAAAALAAAWLAT